jgi:hypothetical protein
MPGVPKAVVLAIALMAVAVPVSLGAGRAPTALVPTPGPGPCRVQSPKLVSAGTAPRARLRIDLAKEERRTASGVGTDLTRSQTRLADGTLRTSTTTKTLRERITTGHLVAGRVPVTVHATITYVGLSAPAQSFDLSGYSDALDGGVIAAQGGDAIATTDRLPHEPVGVGATWRVVNCDLVGVTYARETRTYRLRSVANRIVVATYQDVLELDPAHVALGSVKEGAATVHLQLVELHGTATGTWRVPLANGLGESRTTVSRLETVARGTASGLPTALIHVTTVDTEMDPPAR